MSVVDKIRTFWRLFISVLTFTHQKEKLQAWDENLRLKKENLQLKEQIEPLDALHFRRKLYWRDGDKVPFCPYCYDESNGTSRIHLNGPEVTSRREQTYDCRKCGTIYSAKAGKDFYSDGCDVGDHTE